LVEPIYSESPDWSTNPLTGQAPPQINGIKKKVNGQKENKKKVKKKVKKKSTQNSDRPETVKPFRWLVDQSKTNHQNG